MENTGENKKTQQELKHLGFIRAAAINTIMWLSSVYDYAKQNSGPLRSAVGAVENAVTTVVRPVCDQVKDVPDHFLVFFDQKVDKASAKFDEHAPPVAKKVACKVHSVIKRTCQTAQDLVDQARLGGPLAAAHYAAKEGSELVLEQSVKVWSKLDRLPPFHIVAEMTVPTAAHLSEKYNDLITKMRGKGYVVFSCFPLVPIDDIVKAFKQSKAANEGNIPNPQKHEDVSQ